VQRDDHDFLNTSMVDMEDKVPSLLGEVGTHDVLKKHFRGLKHVEININNLPNVGQECEHT